MLNFIKKYAADLIIDGLDTSFSSFNSNCDYIKTLLKSDHNGNLLTETPLHLEIRNLSVHDFSFVTDLPNCLVVVTFIGGSSYSDLQTALMETPNNLRFVAPTNIRALGDMALASGLKKVVCDSDFVYVEYRDSQAYFRDLQSLGLIEIMDGTENLERFSSILRAGVEIVKVTGWRD